MDAPDLQDVIPGWSVQFEDYQRAYDPLIDKIGDRTWAAIELGTEHISFWSADYIKGVLGYRNNRYFNAVNWEVVKATPAAVNAMKEALNE